MRKKSLVLLLVMALTVMTVLSGCGSKGGNSGESTEGTADAGSFKVGFICLHDENSTYDLNFINGAKEACKNLGISEENYIITRKCSSAIPPVQRLTQKVWITITMHLLLFTRDVSLQA